MEELLDSLLAECRPYTRQGKVATYIPELAKGDPSNLGIYVLNSDGRHYQAGDWQKHFTIQSVVKPILLLLALLDNGEEVVRSKVGVEATGKPFDAINVTDSPLLSEHLNPMVNMGAIAICTLLKGKDYTERFQRLLEFTRLLAGNPEIEMDEAVYRSEKRTGSKNRALAFLLKSYGMLDDGVEEVLDCYFRACSIRVNSRDLAHISFALANHGKALQSDAPLFPARYARYVNAIMPVLPAAVEAKPVMGCVDEFNGALKALCEGMGIPFLDNGDILDGHEDWYQKDSVHLTSQPYPLWLARMEEAAGL